MNSARMSQAARETRVIRTIAKNIDLRQMEVCPAHRLREDLNCDSLDRTVIAMALEEEFGIRIKDNALDELTTVQQIIDHIAGVCTGQRNAAEDSEASLMGGNA